MINEFKNRSLEKEYPVIFKGITNIIPNQSILINAIILKKSKDISEIENIISTKYELYKAVSKTLKKLILLQTFAKCS